ncbi:HU family DNA-binding protein [Aliiroseovarius sp. F47248L]|uniref:HU family DNA-binding protein n=1 Tax=Aliiroseovarius sp. F47248L TaxID=2926420 RepID=UPI001FF6EE30|nr:HU family DNA-binding protein [Aliiroseovarius sp. F47248L]MCK0139099.1 HU family DNA-binding protein [Aliiroseovarius sp. F47248L]
MAVSPKSKSKTMRSSASADKAVKEAVAPLSKSSKPDESKPTAPSEPVVKTKEMLARVAARTELRPIQVRDVYEAVLEELGAALVRGEKLRIPPLGTVKVNRQKTLPDADVVICKIRRNKMSAKVDDPLAPVDD